MSGVPTVGGSEREFVADDFEVVLEELGLLDPAEEPTRATSSRLRIDARHIEARPEHAKCGMGQQLSTLMARHFGVGIYCVAVPSKL